MPADPENRDSQQFLRNLDKKLWSVADRLRANLEATVYKHAVLGLIFFKYVAARLAITKGPWEQSMYAPFSFVLAAFERLTTPWFDQIDLNRTQSRTLATLRDTLLPKLLSGELALNPVSYE